MTLGAALTEEVREHRDPLVRQLKIKISGCPNSCGQHWIADLGFYGNARKIEGREVPYYQMLLGGGYDQRALCGLVSRFRVFRRGWRRWPCGAFSEHYKANRGEGETFREYVLRHKVETFRLMTNDLAKPAECFRRCIGTGVMRPSIRCNSAAGSVPASFPPRKKRRRARCSIL